MIKGEYTRRTICRLCGAKNLTLFLDLGETPLAGNFLLKNDIGTEKFYPLQLYQCNTCTLIQMTHIFDEKDLFADYRYLSSIGLTQHFIQYAQEMVTRFSLQQHKILEIGSNDGVLLEPLKKLGVDVLGIDPAKNVARLAHAKNLPTLTDFFSVQTAKKLKKDYGVFKAIFANNVFAHIDTMHDIFEGIEIVLDTDGVVVFEVHYLPDLLKKLQYDFFYHEHMSYYTLMSLQPFVESFGFTIFDSKRIPIHSGSIRVYIKRKDNKKFPYSYRVAHLAKFEERFLLKTHIYQEFSKRVEKQKKKLVSLLAQLKKEKKKIIGYGASGRGNTLLNVCNIDTTYLDYIVDDSPERYGRYTPGTHIPIIPSNAFHADKLPPDAIVLLAWNYTDMIMEKEKNYVKKGSSYIIPLPTVKIRTYDA